MNQNKKFNNCLLDFSFETKTKKLVFFVVCFKRNKRYLNVHRPRTFIFQKVHLSNLLLYVEHVISRH